MITNDVSTCPKCGGDLKYYDRVTRIVRTKGRKTWKIPMRRLQCTRCGSVHAATVMVSPTRDLGEDGYEDYDWSDLELSLSDIEALIGMAKS